MAILSAFACDVLFYCPCCKYMGGGGGGGVIMNACLGFFSEES